MNLTSLFLIAPIGIILILVSISALYKARVRSLIKAQAIIIGVCGVIITALGIYLGIRGG